MADNLHPCWRNSNILSGSDNGCGQGSPTSLDSDGGRVRAKTSSDTCQGMLGPRVLDSPLEIKEVEIVEYKELQQKLMICKLHSMGNKEASGSDFENF